MADVEKELLKATLKFPVWPTDPLHAVAILNEEVGELNKAALQCAYEPGKSTLDDVRDESIQTAAMAIRFLMSLDVYNYRESAQHSQDGLEARPNAILHSGIHLKVETCMLEFCFLPSATIKTRDIVSVHLSGGKVDWSIVKGMYYKNPLILSIGGESNNELYPLNYSGDDIFLALGRLKASGYYPPHQYNRLMALAEKTTKEYHRDLAEAERKAE
jgi:hypothetical protein